MILVHLIQLVTEELMYSLVILFETSSLASLLLLINHSLLN